MPKKLKLSDLKKVACPAVDLDDFIKVFGVAQQTAQTIPIFEKGFAQQLCMDALDKTGIDVGDILMIVVRIMALFSYMQDPQHSDLLRAAGHLAGGHQSTALSKALLKAASEGPVSMSGVMTESNMKKSLQQAIDALDDGPRIIRP